MGPDPGGRVFAPVLLAGAFQAVAIATKNTAVWVIATILFVAMAAQLGLGYARFVLIPLLTRPKKVTLLRFVAAMLIATSFPLLMRYLGVEMNDAARAIASSAKSKTS